MMLSCCECGKKVDSEKIKKDGRICPYCKKETSWFTEPEFGGVFKDLIEGD